jgi:hypothetical protein
MENDERVKESKKEGRKEGKKSRPEDFRLTCNRSY